jgi:hypothetical protein
MKGAGRVAFLTSPVGPALFAWVAAGRLGHFTEPGAQSTCTRTGATPRSRSSSRQTVRQVRSCVSSSLRAGKAPLSALLSARMVPLFLLLPARATPSILQLHFCERAGRPGITLRVRPERIHPWVQRRTVAKQTTRLLPKLRWLLAAGYNKYGCSTKLVHQMPWLGGAAGARHLGVALGPWAGWSRLHSGSGALQGRGTWALRWGRGGRGRRAPAKRCLTSRPILCEQGARRLTERTSTRRLRGSLTARTQRTLRAVAWDAD